MLYRLNCELKTCIPPQMWTWIGTAGLLFLLSSCQSDYGTGVTHSLQIHEATATPVLCVPEEDLFFRDALFALVECEVKQKTPPQDILTRIDAFVAEHGDTSQASAMAVTEVKAFFGLENQLELQETGY